MPNLLANYPVTIEQPVAWGDLDPHGHVNNVWFFRYIENARVAYYERIGKYDHERETGISFVLAATACNFKNPLSYPATVIVGARVGEIKSDRMAMLYRLVNPAQRHICAEASATLVCYDYHKSRITLFPKTLRQRIEALQEEACS